MKRHQNPLGKFFKLTGIEFTSLCLLVSLIFSPLLCETAWASSQRFDKCVLPIEKHKGMVWISAESFQMGCSDHSFPDARPIHRVHLSGFWLDKTPVTNEEFAQFVTATNYVTMAERKPEAKDFPNVPEENLVAGSLVFRAPENPVPLSSHYQWWQYMPAANWRHPEGPNSDIKNRMNHPVVHIAWQDAMAYAKWAGKRLPTEAEFEYASRGGLKQKSFSWGDELKPDGKWQANIWQGHFPYSNTKEDGYFSTSPVGSFPANAFGLYDMTGNVWQWCSDWYRYDYYKTLPHRITNNPQGPLGSYDPREPGVAKRVQRGGSFLCSDQYCARYLVGARGKGEPDSSSCHVGFRCARGTADRSH